MIKSARRLLMVNTAALKWGIGSWAALRFIASAGAWFSVNSLRMDPAVQTPGYIPPAIHGGGAARLLLAPWLRQDALQYLKIATQGYHDRASLAFYPAFPILTGALSKVTGNELIAGLLIANLACLVGLVLLFDFVEKAAGQSAARAATVGLALFPTAFFLVAPYAESLLLAFGAGALVAAISGRFLPAFFLGMAAAVSRPFGVLLALPLAAIAFEGAGKRRWLPPLGPLAGIAGWIVFSAFVGHDPMAAFNVQRIWQRQPAFFPATLVNGFIYWRKSQGSGFENYFLLDLAAAVFSVAILPAAARIYRPSRPAPGRPAELIAGAAPVSDRPAGPAEKRPDKQRSPGRILNWGLVAYGAAFLIVATSTTFAPRPLLSLPRFVLALFPLFGAVGLLRPRLRIPVAFASGLGLFAATAVYVASRPLF